MDAMDSDFTIVSCLEPCPEDETKIKALGEGYTMQSLVCVAAKIFYKNKDEYNQKEYGVRRLINKEMLNGSVPP